MKLQWVMFKKEKKKSSLQWWKCLFFLCSWYMWLYILCYWEKNVKNKKETKVCNFKLESEVHQTNKKETSHWVFLSRNESLPALRMSSSWPLTFGLSQKGWEENLLKKCYSRGNNLHEPCVHYSRGGRTDPWLALRLSANVSRPWFLSAEVIHVM